MINSRDFSKKFDEAFSAAWDSFNDLLRGCLIRGFRCTQIDTIPIMPLNSNDQDSLNSADGGDKGHDASAITEAQKNVQPPVVQIQTRNPNPEPNVAPVRLPSCRQGGHHIQRGPNFKNYQLDYNLIDRSTKSTFIDMACDEYSQEGPRISNVIASLCGISTPYFEPIVSTASPNSLLSGDSDFLLNEEADPFRCSWKMIQLYLMLIKSYQDPKGGDILILEAIFEHPGVSRYSRVPKIRRYDCHHKYDENELIPTRLVTGTISPYHDGGNEYYCSRWLLGLLSYQLTKKDHENDNISHEHTELLPLVLA
ncbi:hypothetical protein Tco_0706621 [Tanacetum coccineum]|uniref:Uncharacterized protein n=1 Tax=Tanacetum coccineum TaxID=301880 RepID=A0ABQ4Y9Y6_9ASTR